MTGIRTFAQEHAQARELVGAIIVEVSSERAGNEQNYDTGSNSAQPITSCWADRINKWFPFVNKDIKQRLSHDCIVSGTLELACAMDVVTYCSIFWLDLIVPRMSPTASTHVSPGRMTFTVQGNSGHTLVQPSQGFRHMVGRW